MTKKKKSDAIRDVPVGKKSVSVDVRKADNGCVVSTYD